MYSLEDTEATLGVRFPSTSANDSRVRHGPCVEGRAGEHESELKLNGVSWEITNIVV